MLYEDSYGLRHEISAGGGYRDVTKEVKMSLQEECRRIKKLQARLNSAVSQGMDGITVVAEIGMDFYRRVNHKAPWDIKRKEPWESTIGTQFPGAGKKVRFDGIFMTPEMLGNFAYGYLGCKYGISLPVLYAGSYYAAGFPMGGKELDNELWDRKWIAKGHDYAITEEWGK